MGKQQYADSTNSHSCIQGQPCLIGSKNQQMVRAMATTLTWNTGSLLSVPGSCLCRDALK